MALLIAHAGHWLESAAFALPPVLMIALLLGAALLARRNERPRTGNEGEAGR